MAYAGDSYFMPEARVCLPGITAELGEYRWGGPYETIFDTHDTHIAAMMLSPRPAVFSGYYIHDKIAGECGEVGEVTFSPAGTTMYQRSTGTPQRIIRFAFDVERFRTTTELSGDWDRPELKACLDMRAARLAETMWRVAEELETPGFGTAVWVESLTMGAMVEIARYLRSVRTRTEDTRAVLAPWQLRRINQYLNEVTRHSPTISDLAEQCGVSRGHLSRLFKASTGLTVHDYVVDVRVKRAKAYLSDTELPLKEISSRLGFSQPASFSLAFRKSVGEAPRTYRQRFRKRPTP